jgi:DNA-binding CsgD family transcriptional regulator
MRLWRDRGAPQSPLAVPGLDDVGAGEVPTHVEPPESAQARALRARIRLAPEASWRREYPELVEGSRHLRSPFDRARIEAMLGATCVVRGDRAAGRRHLRAARSLFADAGADAWRASVDARLAILGELLEGNVRQVTVPIPIVSAADPMAACRAAWEQVLTGRELEVAMQVIEGASNREIAAALTVSVRTVEVHVGRILDKLDVRGRVELTALAHRTNQYL